MPSFFALTQRKDLRKTAISQHFEFGMLFASFAYL
jgi:hypothetical protein